MKARVRFVVPEVVQTSNMDCGPAALKSLLEGFGIHAHYGRLREACQTDVDGTSIDTIEEAANELGLEAEQIVVPADHVLLEEARALPAIAVVVLPTGVTHFVIVWRRHGPFVQLMDPATGRRWVRAARFLSDLYVHRMVVPAEDWRAYAGSEDFLKPLRRRLEALEIHDSGMRRGGRSELAFAGCFGRGCAHGGIAGCERVRSGAARKRIACSRSSWRRAARFRNITGPSVRPMTRAKWCCAARCWFAC